MFISGLLYNYTSYQKISTWCTNWCKSLKGLEGGFADSLARNGNNIFLNGEGIYCTINETRVENFLHAVSEFVTQHSQQVRL